MLPSSEVTLDVKIQENSSIPGTTATNSAAEPVCNEKHPLLFLTCEDMLRSLASGLDDSDQFFIVVRRGSSFQRQLKIWQRESNKKSPEKMLRVHFAGEDGIDTGGMAEEFLANSMKDIGREFFPNGSPIVSMLHVHNVFFDLWLGIVAVSLIQGGPPPQFLNDINCNLLVNPLQDLSDLQPDVHLTDHERAILTQGSKDPIAHQDDILQYGYSGIIDTDHVHDIIGTIMVSLVRRRLLLLNEFKRGLELFGLASAVASNASLCRSLFVIESSNITVDANYLVSLLKPLYSPEGTSRRTVEETLIYNFQDFLMGLEDEKMTGYTEMIAWSSHDYLEDEEPHQKDPVNQSVEEENPQFFHSAELTPSGVLGWLTGQRHRPVNGDDLAITVMFNHDCFEKNPNHSVCFPVVSACAKAVTLPVNHMKESEDFTRTFLLAYCKGQAFGRR